MKKILNNLIDFINKHQYYFLILGILLTFYIVFLYKIQDANIYNYNFYVISYKYGFISRGLIGTIFSIVFDYITIYKIYMILNFIFIIFIFFASYLFYILLKKYNNKLVAFVTILLCIFNPASFMLMITMNEFGRFDIFIFCLSIISLILIYKNKFLFLIPIIFILSIFIHQNFIFMYAPLILMIIIYNWLKKKDNKWLKLFLITLCAAILSLGIVLKYGKLEGYHNAEEFTKVLSKTTDVPFPSYKFNAIDAEYFRSIDEHMDLTKERLSITPKKWFVIGFILLISYLYIQYLLCYQFLIKKNKFIFMLLLSCLGSLPLFFIGVDFGRWYMAIINSTVLLLIYLLFDNIKIINKNIKLLENKLGFLISTAFIYLLIIQNYQFTFMEFTKIDDIIQKIKQILTLT